MKNVMYMVTVACLIVVMHKGAGDHIHTGSGTKGTVMTQTKGK